MPIVHDPETGRFSAGGGSAGGAKKADPYAKTYPTGSITKLGVGAKSFKEAGGPKPKEGTAVKLKEGNTVYNGVVKTPGPGMVSVTVTAFKMGREYPELKQSLWENVYPADG